MFGFCFSLPYFMLVGFLGLWSKFILECVKNMGNRSQNTAF